MAASIEHLWCRELWNDFAHQLIESPGRVNKAAKVLMASIDYFQSLEKLYEDRSLLTTASFHERVSSLEHRRHLLAYRFLLSRLGACGVDNEREKSNEKRRLHAVFARARGRPYAPLLEGYVNALRAGHVSERTIRLYAAVTQKFCESAAVDTTVPCSSGAIAQYLAHSPGSASSLSRFICYCRDVLGWQISMPSKATLAFNDVTAQRSLIGLRNALEAVAGRSVGDLRLVEVVRIISVATGLSKKYLLRSGAVDPLEKGVVLISKVARIESGHLLYPYAVRWRELIAKRESFIDISGP
ncbi:hypothetical protein [Derxia gummosa]|uniref:Integrase n=1 Tax=Derxia gummosa DSM 723 TaxID=1121388 RepID=A0A8B6XCL3_9BURK|nr:hypothetical protein [Derxia gummosa]